jgi:hypothetical protein
MQLIVWTAQSNRHIPTVQKGVRNFYYLISKMLLIAHISVYLDTVKVGHRQWPVAPLINGIPDIENVTAALCEGPYGTVCL